MILILIFFGFVVPIFLSLFVFFNIIADFMGAPFVPTSRKELRQVLKKAGLKKRMTFIDLGSGDGGVIREAVSNFGVLGIGIELNPLLIWYSRLVSKITRIKALFYLQNI